MAAPVSVDGTFVHLAGPFRPAPSATWRRPALAPVCAGGYTRANRQRLAGLHKGSPKEPSLVLPRTLVRTSQLNHFAAATMPVGAACDVKAYTHGSAIGRPTGGVSQTLAAAVKPWAYSTAMRLRNDYADQLRRAMRYCVTHNFSRKKRTTCALNSSWNARRSKLGKLVQMAGAARRVFSSHGGKKS
jgi:hypothetical protein